MARFTKNGFTLLEVMIALVIFSIGLLGLAGMQTISLENNRIAYKRTVATHLAYDMADRIRNNPTGDYTYDDDTTDIDPVAKPSTVCVSTTASVCSAVADMVAWDIYEWDHAMRDIKNSNLPNPRGMISKNGSVYTISIGWDESNSGLDVSQYDCSVSPPTPAGLECVSITVEL